MRRTLLLTRFRALTLRGLASRMEAANHPSRRSQRSVTAAALCLRPGFLRNPRFDIPQTDAPPKPRDRFRDGLSHAPPPSLILTLLPW